MSKPPSSPSFDHFGVAQVLKQHPLKLPLNQREYSWEEEHVNELFDDLEHAIELGKANYFLGTIVVKAGSPPEVVDGQQRLATVTILLAAFRDYLTGEGKGMEMIYLDIEQKFLSDIDREERERIPRLTLNVDDNEFFKKRILSSPRSADRGIAPTRASHKRIVIAADLAKGKVAAMTQGQTEKNKIRRINVWLDYLEKNATVILVTTPDDLNAYVMFETLNDRGLKTSQADLLKNFLFGESDDRLSEAQQKWSAMVASLEILDSEDVVMLYLRHVTSALYGATREKEIFEKIKQMVTGKNRTLEFLDALERYAEDYSAMLTPSHIKWTSYDQSIRFEIETLAELPSGLIRPLMLAVAHHFSKAEALKAFRLFISWTVRFLIVGGGRSGALETAYSSAAKSIVDGKIKSAVDLQKSLVAILPKDKQFEESFALARVSKSKLARHYLRALEAFERRDSNPEVAPVKNTDIVNLEHILPQSPGTNWPGIDTETAEAYSSRIGNLVLLGTIPNGYVGNEAFAQKKKVYTSCPIQLTKKVGEKNKSWGVKEINVRQAELAKLAVKTWPILPL
ncbi:MAG: hypothetical protein Greene101449_86 [Candidatus Peregrinibacteria bacterium Greene1014_49]|nr:MAG: hypothetical protein Greene101449_86 [Candidatus Peregrinibacteria bacterium Greene1014_49]